MSEKSLTEQIRHYQKDIDRCPENAERMLRCIKRLYALPIRVEHLSATGVGRSVNGLRKLDGTVADAATALVAKWKAMVAAEDSDYEGDATEDPVQAEVRESVAVTDELCNGTINSEKNAQSEGSKGKENIRNNHSVKSSKGDLKTKDVKEAHKPVKDKKKESSHRDHSSSKSSSKEKVSSSEKAKESSHDKSKSVSKSHHEKHSSSNREKSHSEISKKDKHSVKEKKPEKITHEKIEHKSHSPSKHSKSKERSKSYHHVSSSESEEEVKKPCKRKRSSHSHESSYKKIKIKEEPKSESSASESDSEDDDHRSRSQSSSRVSDSNESADESNHSEASSEHHIKSDPDSDNSDSDHSPPKKHSKSQHHKSSSHSKSKSKHSDKHSSSKKKRPEDSEFTSQELEELIKQNEKIIKKEKSDHGKKEKKSSSSEMKKPKIKIEANQDGSIDSGSGASFADALLGLDNPKKKKKKDEVKKKKSMSGSPSKPGSVTSSNRSSPAPSVTSSIGSSPTKLYRPCSTSDLMKEPELLKKRVKLESPIELDISSTLPEISNNYKPRPYIPEKSSREAPMDENTMFALMTTKNQRTKVFSGSNKGRYFAQVPSLYSLCIQILFENVDGLEYTGGVPYDILKPLLDKLSAEQLLALEHFNHYLIEDTDGLWKFHANKDFRTKQRDDEETWREFYLRCIDERECKLKRLTSNIIESMAKSTPVRQAKLAYVDTVAKPPRNIARKQAKYGTGSSSGESAKIAAAAQNSQKKKEIVSKAVVGAYHPENPATDVVPAAAVASAPSSSYNNPQTAAKILKKKKAPLMAKALQLIKSNSRYKR